MQWRYIPARSSNIFAALSCAIGRRQLRRTAFQKRRMNDFMTLIVHP
jgi:hypothetical protein